jgi:hypothetical protein
MERRPQTSTYLAWLRSNLRCKGSRWPQNAQKAQNSSYKMVWWSSDFVGAALCRDRLGPNRRGIRLRRRLPSSPRLWRTRRRDKFAPPTKAIFLDQIIQLGALPGFDNRELASAQRHPHVGKGEFDGRARITVARQMSQKNAPPSGAGDGRE